jgi:hypothetical protein
MFRVRIPSAKISAEASSPEKLAQLVRVLRNEYPEDEILIDSSEDGTEQSPSSSPSSGVWTAADVRSFRDALPSKQSKLVQRLVENGGSLTTSRLAGKLGHNDPRGLGPVRAAINRAALELHRPEPVLREWNENESSWVFRLDPSFLSSAKAAARS